MWQENHFLRQFHLEKGCFLRMKLSVVPSLCFPLFEIEQRSNRMECGVWTMNVFFGVFLFSSCSFLFWIHFFDDKKLSRCMCCVFLSGSVVFFFFCSLILEKENKEWKQKHMKDSVENKNNCVCCVGWPFLCLRFFPSVS